MVMLGEYALYDMIHQYPAHYHMERNHQGSTTDSSHCKGSMVVKQGMGYGENASVDYLVTLIERPRDAAQYFNRTRSLVADTRCPFHKFAASHAAARV